MKISFHKEGFKMEEDRICGIMIVHGDDDFGYWGGFCLSEEDENAIWQILSKYDTEGCSVRGTWNDVIEDIK